MFECRSESWCSTKGWRPTGRSTRYQSLVVSGCSCGARVVQGRDVGLDVSEGDVSWASGSSDPVEVRVRGESGSDISGAGGRRTGRRPACGASRPVVLLRQGEARDEGGRARHRRSRPTLAPWVTRRTGLRSGPPEAFIWRGRLYVVRSVLATWRERRAGGARRLTRRSPRATGRRLPLRRGSGRSGASRRVPGLVLHAGVYDLAHDDSGADSGRSPGPAVQPVADDSSARPAGLPPPARPEKGEGAPGSGWSLVRAHRLIAPSPSTSP